MTLRIKLLGIEVATVEFDIPDYSQARITPLDKGIKGMSNFWVRRMNR